MSWLRPHVAECFEAIGVLCDEDPGPTIHTTRDWGSGQSSPRWVQWSTNS